MNDPYLYPHTDILKNFAGIQDRKILSCMEAEYTSIRLAELVTRESVSRFDFVALCDMHHYISPISELCIQLKRTYKYTLKVAGKYFTIKYLKRNFTEV